MISFEIEMRRVRRIGFLFHPKYISIDRREKKSFGEGKSFNFCKNQPKKYDQKWFVVPRNEIEYSELWLRYQQQKHQRRHETETNTSYVVVVVCVS